MAAAAGGAGMEPAWMWRRREESELDGGGSDGHAWAELKAALHVAGAVMEGLGGDED